jgi:Tfp pilus assembly protein PilO
MNKVKRQIALYCLYICLVFGLGFYFFCFKFVYPRYKILNEQAKTKQAELTRLTSILQGQTAVEKEYDAFLAKFQADSGQLAATDILKDIKSKAGSAGLNVINVKPFPLKEDGLYSEFDFKLETEGELKNFGRFLYTLDKSPYMFSIKNTQINAQVQAEPLKVQLLLSAVLPKE